MTAKTVRIGTLTLVTAFGAVVVGCAPGGGETLAEQPFTGQRGAGRHIAAPVDEPGPVLYDQVRVNLMDDAPQVEVLNFDEQTPEAELTGVSPTVEQAVRTPTEAAAAETDRPPTTQPQEAAGPPLPEGYLTIGGVVAEVNGTPVFADRVLAILARPLQAKARELELAVYEGEAREMIARQVWELIRAELEFAAAQRNLGPQDRLLADSLTMNWRNRRITEAGGSLQQAIQRSEVAGEDFEALLEEQYRTFMTQVYYQKRVIPRIQISADDMRSYYARHLEDEFTEFDQARFRLIKIDPRKMDSREAALDRISTMKAQLESGAAEFATLASQINHDSYLAARGGDTGVIQRGAFAIPEVEQAVWETPVNQVTDVIETNGAFYLARVEEKQEGRVRQFEEEQVQDAIQSTLRAEQFRELRERVQENLQRSAVIRVDPSMLEIAVEMAVQNYPRWRQDEQPQ